MRGQFIKRSFVGLATRGAAILSGLFLAIILARILEPAGYGVYSFAFAIIALAMIPVQMGLPTLVLRETARSNAKKDWPVLRGIWRWSGLFIMSAAAITVGSILLWLSLDATEISPAERSALIWGLPLIPLMALSATRASALSGLRLPIRSHLIDQILRPVSLSFLLLAAISVGAEVDPSHAMMLHCFAAFLSFAVGAFLLVHSRPPESRKSGAVRIKNRAWLTALLPLSALAAVQTINESADLIILGIFRSDAEVGLYRIAVSSASPAAIGMTAMALILAGQIAHELTGKNYRQLQPMLSTAAIGCTALPVLAVAIYALWGEVLLTFLFGSEYRHAHSALIILTGVHVMNGFFGLNMTLLSLSGLEKKSILAMSVAVALNVVLNLIFIPRFGILAAAYATLASTILWNFICWVQIKMELGIDTTFIPLLRRRLS